MLRRSGKLGHPSEHYLSRFERPEVPLLIQLLLPALENTPCSSLNLSSVPTKAEDLQVKVDEKSRTLTVSGKSEVESTRRDGVKIFSTHVWTKDIRIPDDVELKTIVSKLHESKLTFVADRVQEEDNHQQIPIVIVDAPALD